MVTESAGAARKDIFLHLGVLETNTKKLNVVKDEITQACSENEMQLKGETQFVDELLGKLKQSLVNRIEQEHEKHSVKSKVNVIEELVTTSDASQNECLSYLRQSDGRMVEAFVRSKSENESLTQKTDRMLNEQKKYVNHDFIPLNTDEFVKCTAEKFMREIYLSRVKECLVRKSCESSLVVPGPIIAKRQVKTFWLGSSIFGGFLFEINEGTDDAGLYLKSWSVEKSSNYLIKKKRVKVELRKCEMPSTSVQPYSHKVFYFTASGFDGASLKQKYVYFDSNNGMVLCRIFANLNFFWAPQSVEEIISKIWKTKFVEENFRGKILKIYNWFHSIRFETPLGFGEITICFQNSFQKLEPGRFSKNSFYPDLDGNKDR